ncbi:MAG TPA: hypothetical protein VF132_15060 [Rudaea sp.]
MNHRLLLLAAIATNACAAGDLREIRLDGRLHGAAATTGAQLHVFCSPTADGALGVELIVPDAQARKDFDYDDFEGPDAPAAMKALSRISVSGESGKTEITHAAAGWYGVAPASSFVFGANQKAMLRGKLADLFGTLDGQRGHLVWVQTAFDDSRRELRAAFDFDDATARKLRGVVTACLAATEKPRS